MLYFCIFYFTYLWVLQEVCNLVSPVSLNQFSSPNSWANAIVNRENLKLSQSPIYFKQTIQFIFGNPFENPAGEQRAETLKQNMKQNRKTNLKQNMKQNLKQNLPDTL